MSEDPLQGRSTLILDGGLATELEAQGHNITNWLWSAIMLLKDPHAIKDAHLAYLDAGAQCIITSSYQASRQGFMNKGLSQHEADDTLRLTVQLAQKAVDEFMADNPDADRALVAASVGPYGSVAQHDGSEYTGIYHVGADAIREMQEGRIRILDECGADLLAIETIPNITEVEVLADLLRHTKTPAWISFCCQDNRNLSDGTPLANAVGMFRGHPGVVAVGVNCIRPKLAADLIGILKKSAPDKKIVVYPNSGETFRASDNSWHGTATPGECAAAAVGWKNAGADVIGGCCRMGPEHIREIRKALEAA